MKVRLTPEATANISAIGQFLRQGNPASAKRVRADIQAAVRLIRQYPRAGREQAEGSVRKAVTRQFGYIVYYTLWEAGDQVDILSVMHPAQQRLYSDN